jgi:preprotein translocase subunit SecE
MDAETKPVSGVALWATQSREFLVATRGEMSKVTWPTREELIKATRMIVVLSVVLGLVIGWMDALLNLILVGGIATLTR